MLSGVSGLFSEGSDEEVPFTAIPATKPSLGVLSEADGYVSANDYGIKPTKLNNLPGRRSLDDVHRDAARLIRETKATLTMDVERPRKMADFLQSLGGPGNSRAPAGTHNALKTKPWARLLSAEQKAELCKSKRPPKLTVGEADEGMSVIGPEGLVERKRQRAVLVPKSKKPGIEALNARLDARISLQKRAQLLQMRLRSAHSGDEDAEDEGADLEREKEELKFALKSVREELSSGDEGVDNGSSSSDEGEDAEAYEPNGAIPWKASVAHEPRRRPVIDDSDGGEAEREDGDRLGDLLDDDGAGEQEHSDADDALSDDLDRPLNALFTEKQQEGGKDLVTQGRGLDSLLSGSFTTPAAVPLKQTTLAPLPETTKDSVDLERRKAEQRVRSRFLEEEAEDSDEDEHMEYEEEDEPMDEAAMEAELKRSKFIIEDASDGDVEEGSRNHLDIHRDLMRKQDDAELEAVLRKFAADKTDRHGALARLHEKYGDESEGDEDDVEDNKPSTSVRDMRGRKDAALFELIQAEHSDGDDLDDPASASYSDSDPYHDDAEEYADRGDDVDEEPPMAVRLEDSLAALFTSMPHSLPEAIKPSTKVKGTVMDAERRARLMAATEDDQQQEPKEKTRGAFVKTKL